MILKAKKTSHHYPVWPSLLASMGVCPLFPLLGAAIWPELS